jgi:hypothetical protein
MVEPDAAAVFAPLPPVDRMLGEDRKGRATDDGCCAEADEIKPDLLGRLGRGGRARGRGVERGLFGSHALWTAVSDGAVRKKDIAASHVRAPSVKK